MKIPVTIVHVLGNGKRAATKIDEAAEILELLPENLKHEGPYRRRGSDLTLKSGTKHLYRVYTDIPGTKDEVFPSDSLGMSMWAFGDSDDQSYTSILKYNSTTYELTFIDGDAAISS